MKKSRLAFVILLLFSVPSAHAQAPEYPNASEILLGMKKLSVLGSVLYVAAHPDDENTRLLAWLSKDKLYRTGYLSLTRGDGGQNLIGDEQGIELGLIRTQELLAARRVDGADQFFARAYDFGFSKTTTEALKIWNEQKILSDVVWVIRKFQPDIIITRFPEDKRAGHGQHSASSVLARMAFKAAADSTMFPEQFAFGVRPWQAKRLFWNNYNFGSVNTTRPDQLQVEVGGFNPLVGKSYGEIAADSRSQHRSQGFGVPHSRGNSTEYFSLTAGEQADSGLMQHIDCSWNRVAQGDEIGSMIALAIKNFDAAAPDQSLPALTAIFKRIKGLPEGYWRNEKLKETQDLLIACSGLWTEATVQEAYAIQDGVVPVTLRVLNRNPVSIQLLSVAVHDQDTTWTQNLAAGVNYSVVKRIALNHLPVSQPYWLARPMSPGSYNVEDQTLIGKPQSPPVLEASFRVRIGGEIFIVRQPVLYKYTDPVKGEIFQPLTIVPALLAYADPSLLVFSREKEKELVIRRQIKTIRGTSEENPVFHAASISAMKQPLLQGSISITAIPDFEIKRSEATRSSQNFLLKSKTSADQNIGTWVTHVRGGQTDTVLQCRTISYDHIPRIDYFRPAKSTVVSLNLQTRGNRIGYIEGAGDKVSDALTAMGYTVVKLNENTLNTDVLKTLDAVIAGLRAYEVHEWLSEKYSLLMEYVENGGNLIVQYNRNLGEDSAGIGPYNFGISSARITEEDAAVHFLQPQHAVLHFPNEITSKDFEGWIQERGIYLAQHADPRYQKIFSMHDTGETDLDGSLIIAAYGKGYFSYTGLVFFRELPAGIPGAYRLLANLIALNQQKNK